jgi:hypothetical protein
MSSPLADGVMAATHRLVQQAMSGQWHEIPKTVEQRRALLDQLDATATPQDQQWLGALRQAMAESDAVVAKITESTRKASAASQGLEAGKTEAHTTANSSSMSDLGGQASSTLEWLKKNR